MLKKCTKCGEEKPATPEFFYKRGDRLRTDCKMCRKAENEKNYKNNKEQILQRNK